MTSVSAGHIIQTPTQPVGSGRPQRESNPGPPHQESRALPQSYRAPHLIRSQYIVITYIIYVYTDRWTDKINVEIMNSVTSERKIDRQRNRCYEVERSEREREKESERERGGGGGRQRDRDIGSRREGKGEGGFLDLTTLFVTSPKCMLLHISCPPSLGLCTSHSVFVDFGSVPITNMNFLYNEVSAHLFFQPF